MPESSVYSAIAKLKKLGILNIKSGKLVVDWVKPKKNKKTEEDIEDIVVNHNSLEDGRFSDPRKKFSDPRKKFSDPRKKFSDPRKIAGLQPLSNIDSGISQTLQNIQTNQTRGEDEKNFFLKNQESDTTEAVQKVSTRI